jgi:hypothetical protein
MRPARSFVLLFGAIAFGAMVVVFCFAGWAGQKKDDGKVKVYPVEGKIIVSGRPAGYATLAFHAVDKDRAGGHCPVGITNADGTFRLMTYTHDDGAPEGDYVVTLFWPHDPEFATGVPCACAEITTHDRLFGRYADPVTSELRTTIYPQRNELELHVTTGGKGWNLPRLKSSDKKMDKKDDRRSPNDDDRLRERQREIERDREQKRQY